MGNLGFYANGVILWFYVANIPGDVESFDLVGGGVVGGGAVGSAVTVGAHRS